MLAGQQDMHCCGYGHRAICAHEHDRKEVPDGEVFPLRHRQCVPACHRFTGGSPRAERHRLTQPAARVGTTPAVPHDGDRRFFVACPDGAASAGQRRKEWRDEATEDANDAHGDTERSDTMTKYGEGPGTMLRIGETATLVPKGIRELQTLLFRRKKQREKQRT
jgi:hypothetical protein